MAADAHPGPLGGERPPRRKRNLRAGFFTGAEGQKRRTKNIVEFHDDPEPCASSSPATPGRRPEPSACFELRDQPGTPLESGRPRAADRADLPARAEAADRRLQPRLRAGDRVERIAGLVGSKQAFFKGLFDGESDSIQFDQSSSFLARVEKIYETDRPIHGSNPGGNRRGRRRIRTDAAEGSEIDDEV